MIASNNFENLNIKGQNILKNNTNNNLTDYSHYYDNNINNFVLNSNLDNTNLIK